MVLFLSIGVFGLYLAMVIFNYADDPGLPIKNNRLLFGAGFTFFVAGLIGIALAIVWNVLHA